LNKIIIFLSLSCGIREGISPLEHYAGRSIERYEIFPQFQSSSPPVSASRPEVGPLFQLRRLTSPVFLKFANNYRRTLVEMQANLKGVYDFA